MTGEASEAARSPASGRGEPVGSAGTAAAAILPLPSQTRPGPVPLGIAAATGFSVGAVGLTEMSLPL